MLAATALAWLLMTTAVSAKVTLPSLLGDHMVLQQQALVNLWGEAAPGAKVTVVPSWGGQKQVTQADEAGHWAVRVQTPPAGGPYTIAFRDRDEVLLEDVLIGEVWICSGQSNMQMPMTGYSGQPVFGAQQALMKAGQLKTMRLFEVPMVGQNTVQDTCGGVWSETNSKSLSSFSATGYFFGKYLLDALGVPIGLIRSANPGTRIEAWMPVASAQKIEPNVLATDTTFSRKSNYTGVLYNAMIAPLTRITARGFIWYQGESNGRNYKQYGALMQEMVARWRADWEATGAVQRGDQMPFYYVELAPFAYEDREEGTLLSRLVEQQVEALRVIPNAGIAATVDVGEAWDIHPPRKEIVGERLARLALVQTYGLEGISALSPRFEAVEFADSVATVTFITDSPLSTKVKKITGFEVAGDDRVFHPAQAKVMAAKKVALTSTAVKVPVAVRYSFRNVMDSDLCNTALLPALPFRTDRWDDVQ